MRFPNLRCSTNLIKIGEQMTKKEMIKIMRNDEKNKWQIAKNCLSAFGVTSIEHKEAMAKWLSVATLLNQCEIK
tara:strand:+ start:146 stop:367 length:222 start_codon:yes stop_codon:yes gene_type:complete